MGSLRALSLSRSVLRPPAALAMASALAFAGAGCKGNPGPGLKIQAVEPARGHTCLRDGKVSYPLVPLQDAGTLRVTVLRTDGPKPQLVCDTTVNWPDERPNLDLGSDVPRERLSFFVELFAGGKRAWSGTLPGSASSTADGGAGETCKLGHLHAIALQPHFVSDLAEAVGVDVVQRHAHDAVENWLVIVWLDVGTRLIVDHL